MDNRLKPMKIGIRSVEEGLMVFAEAVRAIERGEYATREIDYIYFESGKAFKNYLIECFGRMSQGIVKKPTTEKE